MLITSFDYDAAGNLVSTTTPAGNTSSYSYDTLNRLRRQILPHGGGIDIMNSYAYDTLGRKTHTSNDKAKAIASEYLEKWGHRLDKNFELCREHLHSVWSDIGDRHAYVYQLDWRRKYGDIYLADGCYLEIDAVDGEVLMCCFPKRNCPMPGVMEDGVAMVNADEAIAIAKEQAPFDAESWGKVMVFEDPKDVELGKIEMDIREKAEKYYEPVYGIPNLTWRVEITYDYICRDESKNETGLVETKCY